MAGSDLCQGGRAPLVMPAKAPLQPSVSHQLLSKLPQAAPSFGCSRPLGSSCPQAPTFGGLEEQDGSVRWEGVGMPLLHEGREEMQWLHAYSAFVSPYRRLSDEAEQDKH